MPATPRHVLVDPELPLFYHLASRVVRRSFLCGKDPHSGNDYSHRKTQLLNRLKKLTPAFAVEVWGFAIMDNHFHLVVFYDPKAADLWSDEELARRWFEAFPPRQRAKRSRTRTRERAIERLLNNPEELQRRRRRLGSLSAFMQALKQPIARQANLEDHCEGHFFEKRFYSGALLDEDALLASMLYVDLNPVRARIVEHLHEPQVTSLKHRTEVLNNTPERLEQAIAPVFSGLRPALRHNNQDAQPLDASTEAATETPKDSSSDAPGKPPAKGPTNDPARARAARYPRPPTHETDYPALVRSVLRGLNATKYTRLPNTTEQWLARMKTLGRPQRAYGHPQALQAWLDKRQLQHNEQPFEH